MKYYLVLKNGIEIEIDKIQAESLAQKKQEGVKEAEVNGQIVNITDTNVSGIFDELALFDREQRKKGSWKCSFSSWHGKFDVCDCGRYTSINTDTKLLEGVKAHYEWKQAIKSVLKGYMQVKNIKRIEDLDELGLSLAKCKDFNELKRRIYEVAS